MATLNHDNPFQSWVLTPEEELLGTILTLNQKQVIQNRIAQYAQEKIRLKYNPSEPLKFLQEDAELQGQILVLQNLIDMSSEAESQLDPAMRQIKIDT